MPYCDEDKLKQRFGDEEVAQLLDRNGDETADTGALDASISDVDGLINGYLRGRYAVPVVGESQVLTGIACDIVRYRLYDEEAPEEVRRRHDQAIRFLEKIASGDIILDEAVAGQGSAGISSTERTREFTDETLSGFMGGLR